VLREDYLDAERKVQDAELANHLESAQQGAQVSVLDSAPVPTSPERPRWLIALAGVGLSGVLALASALLLELFDPVVLGIRQIQSQNSSPILGSLPYVS
jgi:capsular polysaccharide biosynthesis protein